MQCHIKKVIREGLKFCDMKTYCVKQAVRPKQIKTVYFVYLGVFQYCLNIIRDKTVVKRICVDKKADGDEYKINFFFGRHGILSGGLDIALIPSH